MKIGKKVMPFLDRLVKSYYGPGLSGLRLEYIIKKLEEQEDPKDVLCHLHEEGPCLLAHFYGKPYPSVNAAGDIMKALDPLTERNSPIRQYAEHLVSTAKYQREKRERTKESIRQFSMERRKKNGNA